MERKIGEVFEYEGKKLQVKESDHVSCDGCFFEEQCTLFCRKVAGYCEFENRTDGKDVIFVEATEQNQVEQPQELNLCKILRYCPKGEPFWSPMLNSVKFSDIDDERQMIIVETVEGHFIWEINYDGTISIDEVTSPELMLYPSREQRDWTKVKYEPKKEKFDPKTFKAFDKVLCRAKQIDAIWRCDFFSHLKNRIYVCSGYVADYVVPYNDDTKHLVGTTDEAPEYYRYWEDYPKIE